MALFGLFKKKENKNEDVSYDKGISMKLDRGDPKIAKLKKEQVKLAKEVKVLETENKQRKSVQNLRENIKKLKKERFGYSPTGRFVKATQKTYQEGIPYLKDSWKSISKGVPEAGNGLKKGVESNLNMDFMDNFSTDWFGSNNKKSGKQKKYIYAKINGNKYVKIKNPGYKKAKQESYNPWENI